MKSVINWVVISIFVLLISFLALVLANKAGYESGYEDGIKFMQKEAVRGKMATWEPDIDGVPIFQWKDDRNNRVL